MGFANRKLLLTGAVSVGVLFATGAIAAAPAPTDVGEVVVTGSRIVANGYEAPTPVTAISSAQLQKGMPSSLSDAINTLPQFSNSTSLQKTATVQTQVANYHGASLNLRNLGAVRTLVLMDGRRVPPSRYQGIVDVNSIPELLVKRVEVVTGGASAVYGSDAVAGVVNYIIDDNYEGTKAIAQYGRSDKNDGTSTKFGAAFGHNFLDDKLHVLFSAEESTSNPVWRDQRDPHGYVQQDYAFVADPTKAGAGTAANPLFLAPHVVRRDQNATGHITGAPASIGTDLTVSEDGKTVAPWDFGISSGLGNQIGGSGANQPPHSELIFGSILTQLFGQAAYELSPDWKVTANGTYVRQAIHGNAASQSFVNYSVFSGNPFIPAALQSAMTAAGTPSVKTTHVALDISPIGQWEKTKEWTSTLALSGKLSDTWNLDAYYSHGDSKGLFTYEHQLNTQHALAAVDAVIDPASGATVCRATLTNPGLYPGCIPYNIFGEHDNTAAAINYVFTTSWYSVDTTSDDLSAYVNGDLFSTWAGPIKASLGGTYRKNELHVRSNSDLISNPVITTGLRGVPANVPRFQGINLAFTDGSQNVKEASGELNIPLAKDLPFAKSLDLSLAGRWTDYSTSGDVKTWKVGLSYSPIQDLRFRGAISRDIRAPTLYELFAGRFSQQLAIQDPHTLIASSTAVSTAGNPNLKPERGDTKTLGFVYEPGWFRGFSASVDWYDIRVKNAIGSPTTANILLDCEQSGGASSSCALIHRPNPFSDHSAANYPTSIDQAPLNTAFLANRGVDFDASYRANMDQFVDSWVGSTSLRAVVTWVQRYATQNDKLSPVRELAGRTDGQIPKLQGLFSADYKIGGLNLHGQMRYIGRFLAGPSQVYAPGNDVLHPVEYFDATVAYDTAIAGRQTEFYVTVNNIFDKGWPLFPLTSVGSNAPTLYTVYDMMGRYITVGATAQF